MSHLEGFEEYARKMFVVEAIEITEENIDYVASFIGDVVELPDGSSYIEVDRKLAPGISRAYVGNYVTKVGNRHRVYNEEMFHNLYTRNTGDIQQWIDWLNKRQEPGESA